MLKPDKKDLLHVAELQRLMVIKKHRLLVSHDLLFQNFDSSVEETNEYYRTDVHEFNRCKKSKKY